MDQAERPRMIPGLSVLGGAAAGFSTEGLLRDAMARDQAPDRHARRAEPPARQPGVADERPAAGA